MYTRTETASLLDETNLISTGCLSSLRLCVIYLLHIHSSIHIGITDWTVSSYSTCCWFQVSTSTDRTSSEPYWFSISSQYSSKISFQPITCAKRHKTHNTLRPSSYGPKAMNVERWHISFHLDERWFIFKRPKRYATAENVNTHIYWELNA